MSRPIVIALAFALLCSLTDAKLMLNPENPPPEDFLKALDADGDGHIKPEELVSHSAHMQCNHKIPKIQFLTRFAAFCSTSLA